MEFLSHAFHALWKVSLAAVLLGAGLPALFALGIRSLSAGQLDPSEGALRSEAPSVSTAGRIGAYLCFGVVILAALFGIVVIVFGKQIFG